MRNLPFNDNFICKLIESIEASPKKEKICNYIEEVINNCATLCAQGEHYRIFNEYKILMDTLRKELKF